jgi:hypothetical protein
MATTDDRVVTVFRHRAQAQRAVDALLEAGFGAERITLTEPDHDLPARLEADEHTAHAPTPAERGFGAGLGALLGAAAGGLLGRRRRRWTWASVAAWAAFGSAVGAACVALVVWFFGRNRPEPMALAPVHFDEGSLERGRAMVTVDGGDEAARAEAILLEYGGREPGKWRTAKWENEADRPTPPNPDLAEPDRADVIVPTAEAVTIGRDRV